MMSDDDDARAYIAEYGVDPYDSDSYETDSFVLGGKWMPTKWRFLFHWYHMLEHRVVVADRERQDTHDVRIGREPHDWYIEVKHAADTHLVQAYDELAQNRVKRFRTIREAIVLLSIFAHVEYDAWLAELARTSRFTPVVGMDLEMHRLPCKWAFRFGNDDDTIRICQWTMLRDLFGFGSLSKEFKRDFARASALALEQGFDVRTMEPIPLQVEFYPVPSESNALQVKAIRGLTQMAAEMVALEAKYADQRINATSRSPPIPVFRFERLELNLLCFELHPTILTEIQHLLETGVHVHSLTLPLRSSKPIQDVSEWLPVWGSLLQAITGNAAKPTVVRRLLRPIQYSEGILLLPLLSALMSAKCLEYVDLACFVRDERSNSPMWSWLGVAMFSGAFENSIQALKLSTYSIEDHCIQQLREGKEATNHLSHLWQVCTESRGVSSPPSQTCPLKQVVVMKGSTLFPHGCTQATGSFEATTDIQGFLVMDNKVDDTSATVRAMLPGYGLCTVERSALQNKRQRVSRDQLCLSSGTTTVESSRLRTLLIDVQKGYGADPPPRTRIGELLGLTGSSLTSLAIRAEDVEDTTLQVGLLSCPRLENLRLDRLSMQTAEPLIMAYRHGIKISSLDLCGLKIPAEAFDHLLDTLGSDLSSRRHLRKLRFGSKWKTPFGDETRHACQRMLRANTRLQYVHAFHYGESILGTGLGVTAFHHEPVPLCLSKRLAFLSVLRQRQSSIPIPTEESIARVFEFAVTERRLTVEQNEIPPRAAPFMW